ncbi:MAG: YfbK domain-containing protein, partial [Ginsengibacter sp.]
IDDVREAEKILVTEFTQTLYSIANDVYLTFKFNPDVVKEYRLIGYDNKKNVLSEQSDELEGGEIGAGTGNTSVFEIVPAQRGDTLAHMDQILGKLALHYKLPRDTTKRILKYDCLNNYSSFNKINNNLRFASAVCMFGLKLRESKYFPQDVAWSTIKSIATDAAMQNDYLQNEFISLLGKTDTIYYEKKKKRRKR